MKTACFALISVAFLSSTVSAEERAWEGSFSVPTPIGPIKMGQKAKGVDVPGSMQNLDNEYYRALQATSIPGYAAYPPYPPRAPSPPAAPPAGAPTTIIYQNINQYVPPPVYRPWRWNGYGYYGGYYSPYVYP